MISGMLFLLSCAPEPIPAPSETTGKPPFSFYQDGDRTVTLGDTTIEGQTTDLARPPPRLYVLEGRRTPDGYEATRLAEGRLEGGLFSDAWVAGEACSGGFTLAGDVLELRTSGPGACGALAGTYTDLEVLREREEKAAAAAAEAAQAAGPGATPSGTACERYRDCLCELDAAWALRGSGESPFRKGCADAKRLVVTAPDDVEACNTGREMFGGMAGTLGLGVVPAACTAP